jgi:hypothetical protein
MSGGGDSYPGGCGQESTSHIGLSANGLNRLDVAIVAAQNRSELREEIERAIRNGVTRVEVLEILDTVTRCTGGERSGRVRGRVPPEDG